MFYYRLAVSAYNLKAGNPALSRNDTKEQKKVVQAVS
jgi:hypothetical protein